MVEHRFFSAAAIAGSIAEVIYPVPQGLRGRVIDRMDRFLLNTIVESVDFLYRRFPAKAGGCIRIRRRPVCYSLAVGFRHSSVISAFNARSAGCSTSRG